MIYVLCLNPAVDKIYHLHDFAAGKVYVGCKPEIYPGGKGVNVARVLSQLGAKVRLIGFLGEAGGDIVRNDVEKYCECLFIRVPGSCRTTINIIDDENKRETVISEKGPQVDRQMGMLQLSAHIQTFVSEGDIVACSGSLASGLPADAYAQISRLCEKIGAKCVLDCNVHTLPDSLDDARYALGKPNEDELCAMMGRCVTFDPQKIAEISRMLMPPYEKLLCSLGAAGGVLTTEKSVYYAKVPEVRVKSTVGSGDASFAGALFAMDAGMDEVETLRLAMACGAANAMNDAVGSVDKQTVEMLRKKIDVQKIG